MSAKQDHYEVLGVEKGSDQEAVKKAYKKLVLELHPDRTGNDPAATERLKKVNEAYAVLGDAEKRAAYDKYGSGSFFEPNTGDESDNWGWGRQGPGGFSMRDIEDFFAREIRDQQQKAARPRRGKDIGAEIELTLAEAFTGCKKDVHFSYEELCKTCTGTGDKPGTQRTPCNTCHGSGVRLVNQGFVHLRVTCNACQGRGSTSSERCPDCMGRAYKHVDRSLNVTFVPGISDGDRVRLAGQGEHGQAGPGDAYVIVFLEEDKRFQRAGTDLITHIDLNIAEAALGTTKDIKMPDGSAEPVTFPACSQHGSEVRVKNKGMPRVEDPRKRGTLKARVQVKVPKNLTDEQKELLEKLTKTL